MSHDPLNSQHHDLLQHSVVDDARKQQVVDAVTLPANLPDRPEATTASDAAGDVLASTGSSGLDVVMDVAAGTLEVVGEFLGGLLAS